MFGNIREEALEIYYKSGPIVKFLSKISDECPDIYGGETTERLGYGTQGVVEKVTIDGVNYAMKISMGSEKYEKAWQGKATTVGKIASRWELSWNPELFVRINGGDPNKKVAKGDMITAFYLLPCFKKVEEGGKRLDEIMYSCTSDSFSEYIIGVLCGSLYRTGISANFIDMFSFLTCMNPKETWITEIIFMELIDFSLFGVEKCLYSSKTDPAFYREEFMDCLVIQILHAIAVYQGEFKVVHNDLHSENIFIKYLKRGERTEFLGQDLFEADYFHYRIGDVDLYLPWVPFLVKIGDFGQSAKYSEPIISSDIGFLIDEDVLRDSAKKKRGPKVENFIKETHPKNLYVPWSDVDRILTSITKDHTHTSPLINKIWKWFSGNTNTEYSFKVAEKLRPLIKAQPTAATILTNKTLMKKYLQKPEEGRIATLGVAKKIRGVNA